MPHFDHEISIHHLKSGPKLSHLSYLVCALVAFEGLQKIVFEREFPLLPATEKLSLFEQLSFICV
jgi:hypothetical protein